MRLHPEVLPLRAASREMVRELGFLESIWRPAGVVHSDCHALLEIERAGHIAPGELAIALRLDRSTTSRIGARLARAGLARSTGQSTDGRRKTLRLTAKGTALLRRIHDAANARVAGALDTLPPADRAKALEGVSIYARALARSRERSGLLIRPIEKGDRRAVAAIIRAVMPEFGACGPGFAINDPEVDDMPGAYATARRAYFVVEREGRVLGGGGIAPLEGGDGRTCELRKMYFLPEIRGLGLGQELLARCLAAALAKGYRRCYLETLRSMARARSLYERNGFRELARPRGATGHFGCDAWYEKRLRD